MEKTTDTSELYRIARSIHQHVTDLRRAVACSPLIDKKAWLVDFDAAQTCVERHISPLSSAQVGDLKLRELGLIAKRFAKSLLVILLWATAYLIYTRVFNEPFKNAVPDPVWYFVSTVIVLLYGTFALDELLAGFGVLFLAGASAIARKGRWFSSVVTLVALIIGWGLALVPGATWLVLAIVGYIGSTIVQEYLEIIKARQEAVAAV